MKVARIAAPMDGALCELLAKLSGVSKRSGQLLRGPRSQHKTVLIAGLTADERLEHWGSRDAAMSGG